MEKRKYCSYSQESDKQNIKNYRPVSLLPICGKIFERLVFNEIFRFFISYNLISPNQSCFKPRDLCINQLLSITHVVYKPFDDGLEIRGVFQIYAKLPIKSGIRDLFSNWSKTIFLVDYCTVYLIFWAIKSKELCLIDKTRFRPMHTLEFRKDLSLAHCCF